jgi:beta-glucosidase
LSHGSGEPGLQAEFFSSVELSGKPIASRIDTEVNYDRHSLQKPPAGVTKGFARWTGYLTPTESGTYRIGVNGLMDRLYLDNKLIVEDMTPHPPGLKSEEIKLEAGHRYAMKLEYMAGQAFSVKLVWAREIPDAMDRAIAAAKQADVVIGVVGITSDLEGEEMKVDVPGFKGGDRTSLDLPKQEEDLLEAVKGTGKPLVVVLMNGSALSVNWAAEHANAILEAWYSGEEGGTAIAETLAGSNNPSGKLSVTFYKGVDQLPDFTDYSMANRTYRYFHGEPLYPFGYGLSYSKFSFSNLKFGSESVHAGDPLDVQVDVTNISDRDGDEVVEAYLVPPQTPGNPLRALRGFRRVHVAKGATEHVQLTLQPRDLSFVNEGGDRMIAPGAYQLVVGDGQPQTQAATTSAQFTIVGEQKLPE